MRLIYFHVYEGGTPSGVNKKIFSQAINFYKSGCDFELRLFGESDLQPPDATYLVFFGTEPVGPNDRKTFRRLRRQYLLKKYIRQLISDSDSETIFYSRYPLPILLLPHDLPVQRRCKIVFECNSIEINEHLESKDMILYIRELLFGRWFRRNCDAIIGVTNEITQYQLRRSRDNGKPHLTMGNGFDVESVTVRCPPYDSDYTLEILVLATLARWHGVDRILNGIAQYDGPVLLHLHVVGDGPELENLKHMSDELKIRDKVTYYGYRSGESLDALFSQCHVAAGSLGMQRIGLTEGAILKTREYCARGIPFLSSTSDPDFLDDFPFIHKISPDETLVNIEEIIDFSRRVNRDRDHPRKMRAYALEHLDWSVKTRILAQFLETLIDET